MGEVLNYKDLPVVQRCFELVRKVNAFVKELPATAQGRTISDQLFRAATSIGANIAEGRGRDLGKEYERYLRIARASANETDYWLPVAHQCGLLSQASFDHMIDLVEQCLRMLSAMLTKLRNNRSILHEPPEEYAFNDQAALDVEL